MAAVRTAEIIAVGTELLTPHRLDTNSLWLTSQLGDLGITVRAKLIVGDDRTDLAALFGQSLSRADLVITTGGLGPTHDDLTREVVAGVLGRPLAEDAGVLAAIRGRFERRGWTMPDINRRQAFVPEGAGVLENPNGTAPGLWLESGDRVVVLLPGPPRELQPMFERAVQPRLARLASGRPTRRRVVKLAGRAESQVAEVAEPVYERLTGQAVPIRTSVLASPGQIELHLIADGPDAAGLESALDAAVVELSAVLGTAVVSVDGRTLEEVVGDLLHERRLTIAVAESCTGGLILGRLTDVPGSSAWVLGGVVAYANDVKRQQLGVPSALLEAEGAVSERVAEAMAEGVCRRLGADVGLAVTGIAGPSGGTPDKPVGTVVCALAGPRPTVRTLRFGGDRQMVRQFTVAAGLDMVRRGLLQA